MKMKNKKDFLTLFVSFFLVLMLILFSSKAKAGALSGFNLAVNSIIPSLLPVMIIFSAVTNSSCNNLISKMFSKITTKIFKLPSSCASAIIFGLIGGYPTGCLLCKELLDKKAISKNQARRIMEFNVNGGIAFTVTAVGTGLLNNTKAGWILFFSTTVSALMICLFRAIFYKKEKIENLNTVCNTDFSTAIQTGCKNSVSATLNMTAFIMLFSAFMNIFDIPKNILPLLEITNGLFSLKEIRLEYMAFFLAFGGFCIHLQLYPIICEFKMKYARFLLFRVIHAFLSFFVCKLLLLAFPVCKSVFSNISQTTADPFTVNAAFCFLMIFGCIVFIFDLKNKKHIIG